MLDDYSTALVCPHCAAIHEASLRASTDEGAPEDGNISICVRCEALSIYDSTMPGGLRLPTGTETAEAMQSKEVQRAMHALKRSHYLIKAALN